jgi:hypothetical protein
MVRQKAGRIDRPRNAQQTPSRLQALFHGIGRHSQLPRDFLDLVMSEDEAKARLLAFGQAITNHDGHAAAVTGTGNLVFLESIADAGPIDLFSSPTRRVPTRRSSCTASHHGAIDIRQSIPFANPRPGVLVQHEKSERLA